MFNRARRVFGGVSSVQMASTSSASPAAVNRNLNHYRASIRPEAARAAWGAPSITRLSTRWHLPPRNMFLKCSCHREFLLFVEFIAEDNGRPRVRLKRKGTRLLKTPPQPRPKRVRIKAKPTRGKRASAGKPVPES
jgi:hypothetical protein